MNESYDDSATVSDSNSDSGPDETPYNTPRLTYTLATPRVRLRLATHAVRQMVTLPEGSDIEKERQPHGRARVVSVGNSNLWILLPLTRVLEIYLLLTPFRS